MLAEFGHQHDGNSGISGVGLRQPMDSTSGTNKHSPATGHTLVDAPGEGAACRP